MTYLIKRSMDDLKKNEKNDDKTTLNKFHSVKNNFNVEEDNTSDNEANQLNKEKLFKEVSISKKSIKNNHANTEDGNFKWYILILSCISLVGNYYCFDSPGAMKNIIKKQLNGSAEDFEYIFSMMYSLYSIPNIVLPLLGGVLILKLGNRFVYILCAFLIMLGQFIFVLGISKKSTAVALIGRAIFGLGGETINTTQSTMLFAWFPVWQISLVFGISLSCGRMSAVLNDFFSPKIATSSDISTSLWIGFTLCSISFITTMFLVYMDWRQTLKQKMKEITKQNENAKENENHSNISERNEHNSVEEVDGDSFSIRKVMSLNKVSNLKSIN